MAIQSEWLSDMFCRTDWDISLCPEPAHLYVVAISVSDSSPHFGLAGIWPETGAGSEQTLHPQGTTHGVHQEGTEAEAFFIPTQEEVWVPKLRTFFWSRSGPLTTCLFFGVYTHSVFKLVPLWIWCLLDRASLW